MAGHILLETHLIGQEKIAILKSKKPVTTIPTKGVRLLLVRRWKRQLLLFIRKVGRYSLYFWETKRILWKSQYYRLLAILEWKTT